MIEIKWTTDVPVQEGYYWTTSPADYVDYGSPTIVRIELYNGVLMVEMIGIENIRELSDFSHWCGPMPEPERP